jgi:hypothetical protein
MYIFAKWDNFLPGQVNWFVTQMYTASVTTGDLYDMKAMPPPLTTPPQFEHWPMGQLTALSVWGQWWGAGTYCTVQMFLWPQ